MDEVMHGSWRRPLPSRGQARADIDTPALMLDMDAVEANIARMARWFADKPCKLRPHAKTHKLPLIARKQIEAGAVGITCAKLSEAEAFLREGIKDVLVANQIVGERKIERLMEVARLGNLIICVDDVANARAIAAAATGAGLVIRVLIEVDVGLRRCGVKPGEPALELARAFRGLQGIDLAGIMGYEGGCFIKDEKEKAERCASSYRALVATRDTLTGAGIPVGIVTAGGSNTYLNAGDWPGITDLQVGSYVTMDGYNREYGLDFAQAVSVLATVVSRPEPERAIIDAGMKTISTDHGLPLAAMAGVAVERLDEEHGRLTLAGPARELAIGDTIELIPRHGCTTIPLHEQYVLMRGGRVEGVAPIAGRGALY
jgi:D-serine deaminase-like pyridoxal phosphate-dependent protein